MRYLAAQLGMLLLATAAARAEEPPTASQNQLQRLSKFFSATLTQTDVASLSGFYQEIYAKADSDGRLSTDPNSLDRRYPPPSPPGGQVQTLVSHKGLTITGEVFKPRPEPKFTRFIDEGDFRSEGFQIMTLDGGDVLVDKNLLDRPRDSASAEEFLSQAVMDKARIGRALELSVRSRSPSLVHKAMSNKLSIEQMAVRNSRANKLLEQLKQQISNP